MKHTKGPWEVRRHSATKLHFFTYNGNGYETQCKVETTKSDVALLIAAAPELLEASKALSDAIAKLDAVMPYQCRLEIIGQLRDLRNAINKATGGAE